MKLKLQMQMLMLLLGLVGGLTVGASDVIIDGQVIQGTDISAISIDPTSGNISITAGSLYTVTREGGGGGGGPQVYINSLTASPTSITAGGSVVISWTTTDADQCTPSGGVSAWTQTTITRPSGSSAQITLSTQGTYTFTLTCTNATPTSATRSVTVNVNPVVVNSSCPSDFVAPLSGNTVAFKDFTGYEWPGLKAYDRDVDIAKGKYLAIQFNTGSHSIDGIFKTVTYYATQGARLGAISKCAGDFKDHLPDLTYRCTYSWYTGGSLYWTSEPNPSPSQCVLQPNTTYYFNLTFTADGVNADTNQCSTSICRTEFNSGWY